jgi:predicted nucleic acid-binding protein
MTREPRVVVDTNVLVSFLLRRGSTPWRVVKDVLESGELLVSDDTFAELEAVLRRPKFDGYVARPSRAVPDHPAPVRDPRRDRRADRSVSRSSGRQVLETAVNGQADFLVTGDRALLAMRTFRSVVIVSPSGYLRVYRGQP